MGVHEADRRASEMFCNDKSKRVLEDHVLYIEHEPTDAGFLWATSESLVDELHSGAYRHCLALRNAVVVVERNFRRLLDGGLAGGRINLLILRRTDSSATSAIVDLTPLNPQILETFPGSLTSLLLSLTEDQDPKHSVDGIRKCIEEITSRCELDFPSLQIKYPKLPETIYTSPTLIKEENGFQSFKHSEDLEMALKSFLKTAQAIVEVIDLAILTFAKAHFGAFDVEPLSSAGEVLSISQSDFPGLSILVHRLPLRCLSKMLGDEAVWVFEQAGTPSKCEPLYLRTTIETFAEVWGPVWSVSVPQDPSSIESYAVGGGSIVPCRPDTDAHQVLEASDRLCHWFSRDETLVTLPISSSNTGNPLKSRERQGPSSVSVDPEKLKSSDILVIGAGSEPGLRWQRCRCPVDFFKRQLKESDRMDYIIADPAYRFIDARQIGVVAGSHGLTVGMNVIYKDKKETPLKHSLLDRWEHEPHTRDPRELENFWGVAVSLCTMNARRVRLIDLLGVESVTNLVEAFLWSDRVWDRGEGRIRSEMRDRYLEAVQSPDPYELGDLWEQNPSWRDELGNVVLVCLKILSKTGYDPSRDEFHILWTLPHFRGPRRVTLKAEDQSWIRFLRDTTDSMAMAVIVEDSLGQKSVCGKDRQHWFKLPSLLETSICVNSQLEPFQRLKTKRVSLDPHQWIWGDHCTLWPKIWDISRIKRGDLFWTGAQTRLEVLRCIGRWALLLRWHVIKRDKIRQMIGLKLPDRISHWEYTNEEEEEWEIRPIPVHITS
ncbi:MAG: hypothetical protein Q9201_002077 [Fulgogasparrea decipioides]